MIAIPNLTIGFFKPLNFTSFDAVKIVKRDLVNYLKILNNTTEKIKIKVGHAGTLDPLATGLLIICIGKHTKNIDSIQAQEKEYTGTFFIGATTPSFDLETLYDKKYAIEHITNEMIIETAKKFEGEILQMPPAYSAIKINGQRSYNLARAGMEPVLKNRPVTIYSFLITRIALPEVEFKIVCSKGTYIRSIARDFGLALNAGAHLTSLCRTRIGNYNLQDAFSPQNFSQNIESLIATSLSNI